MKKIAVYLVLSFITAFNFSQAQTSTNLYYDANGTTAGIGGTGNWTTTGANWTTSSAGTAALISGAWTNSATWTNSNANNAILQETTGTLSLSSGTIYANQIQVNTIGFTIQNSSTSGTGSNRYFRTKNGIVLANGVNLNISSGITTNGAVTGFEGPIVGINGTNSVSTGSSITITGSTVNADSSVRIGLDTSTTDIWVPVIVATTGNGYALFRVTGTAQPSIYGNVTVNSGSRLTLGGDTSVRRINVRGNLTTVNTDLTIGEVGMTGIVVLYGTNSIGGNVVANCGLGFGSTNAFGSSTVVLNGGAWLGATSFGTGASDRTLPNNINVLGNVIFGLNGQAGFSSGAGSYLGGNINLNNATRILTITNTTYFLGSVTNGGINLNSGSATVTAYLSGTNSLSSLTFTQGVVALNSVSQRIDALTMNGQTNTAPTLLIQNPATNSSVSTGGTLVLSGTNNTVSFTNNNLPAGTYTLLQGTNLDVSTLSSNGLTMRVIVPTTGTNTTNYPVALNAAPVTWQRYIYTFSNTPTSLVATLAVTSPDLSWNVASGDWNTNPDNQPWILDGSQLAFQTGDNVAIGTGGTLNVDNGGVSAGYVTISGSSNSTVQGGAITALAVIKNGSGTNTLSSATTLSQGLTVNDGLMTVSGVLSYTNDTVINGGTLQTSGDERIPDGSFVRINTNGATFRLGGNETVRGLEGVSNSIVDLPTGTTLTMGSAGSSVASTNFFNITGAGALIKIGTNQVSFRGNNVLNSLTVSSGRADFRGSNSMNTINVSSGALLGYGVTNRAFGDAVINLSGGSSIGQIITMGTNDADRTIPNNLRVLGDVNLGISSYGCYFSGNVDLTSGSRAMTLLFSSYFYGSMTNGDLVVDISNTSTNAKFLYLMGTNNSFASGVTLRPTFTGFPLVLSLGNSNALGSGKLTLAGNGGLANSAAMTVTNPIEIYNNTLTVTNSSALTLSGPLSGTGGNLVKANSGTLTLSGVETYTGVTTVLDGTLVNVSSNLTATITSSTLSVVFSNIPVVSGNYPILPGALTGSYSPTSASLSSNQIITFNPGNSGEPASVTVASKTTQTITELAATDTKTFGASSYPLSVTPGASSSPLTFSSDNNSVATVSSVGEVTIVGAGSTTIRVNQAGDASYLAASEVSQVLTVAKANPNITAAPTASDITSGQALSSSILSGGTASVAGSFGWTSPSTVPTGTGSFSVTFTPSDAANYNTATTDVSVTVNAPTPTGPTFDGAYPGKNLSGVAPNGLSYLMNYAFGGSDNTEPRLPVQDTSDPAKLTLVAYVRTGDNTLSVSGEAAATLDFSLPSNAPYVVITNSDAPAGMEKRSYSVSVSGDRMFLRLKAIKQ